MTLSKSVQHSFEYNTKTITLSSNFAQQADGSVLLSIGDTRIHAVISSVQSDEKNDFFPLLVQVLRKHYASGSITGGHIKRENTRGNESEIIASRLVDRALRPLFPEGYSNEVQIFIEILSTDPSVDLEVPCFLAASAALAVSKLPFTHAVAAVKVGRVGGKYIINPTSDELASSDLNLLLAGKPAGSVNDIVMIEAQAKEVSEDDVLKSFQLGLEAMNDATAGISSFAEKHKAEHPEFAKETLNTETATSLLTDAEINSAHSAYENSLSMPSKKERNAYLSAQHKQIAETLVNEEITSKQVMDELNSLRKDWVYQYMLKNKKRIDGRDFDTVRPINIQTNILPRVHGDAIFQRGETSALATATLAPPGKGEYMELLSGAEIQRSFMLYYNFPHYSVGEVGRMGPPKRREIGHGILARKALEPVLPSQELFPYTLRVVSEIMSCNGSSSMASVCGGSLALRAAGVPIKSHVAGVAMGLVLDGETPHILTDILGDEDHIGDMDLKVAGTESGITALQMDIKIDGITHEMLSTAIHKAKIARTTILSEMDKALPKENEVSGYAPRMINFDIKTEKIKDVIGKGGSVIRGLIEQFGVEIDISDSGTITIASSENSNAEACKAHILELVSELEVGQVFAGKITKILDFGAVVAFGGGKDGFLHISQISYERINEIRDYLSEGQEVTVKVTEIDRNNKVRLSMKDLGSDSQDGQE
ncbi:polyribonucleotide nucleotidyltransferase [Candidatus Comchoanobacter bicostacola]|uniref:Polyribonucleotide nucleotidyltransferase n=1 Tax=Candidatus Comchoanobacter bicostacola TaxID=2919598 RepID=A0ABY5DM59_9GAMM|nr:polyribonucleotide nucleotidyltransferase [Candidatus Comchoanobacter bicostacola]UTC24821.1 polyribonucleotide nucleotidyltransferase [Candidatus Comchoanobacter bicostacola]